MRQNAAALDRAITSARGHRGEMNAVERIETSEEFAKLRADNDARLFGAFRPPYASLSPAQQQMANRLMMVQGRHRGWQRARACSDPRDRGEGQAGRRSGPFGRPLPPGRFPIAPVDGLRLQCGDVDTVEAAGVDVNVVGVRPRHIERVHAAMPAEGVAGCHRVELIVHERIATA
jgi:hypothetical protein